MVWETGRVALTFFLVAFFFGAFLAAFFFGAFFFFLAFFFGAFVWKGRVPRVGEGGGEA